MSAKIVPCWRVSVLYTSFGGGTKVMASKPMTYTQAKAALLPYLSTGHRARLEPIDEVMDINRDLIAGEISRIEAQDLAAAYVDPPVLAGPP